MLRHLMWIVPVLLISSVGCSTCGDRKPLFPRLNEFFNGKDDRELPSRRPLPPERYDDRYGYAPMSTANPTNCAPCDAGNGVVMNNSYGNMPVGVPLGSSVLMPGYSGGGSLGTPQLSAPVMPRGSGMNPDNELPNPGGYSSVSPAEVGRSTAPKPLTTLIGK